MFLGETTAPLLLCFGAALTCALALTPLARWAACRLGIVDAPDGARKLQKTPVALLGGVALLASFAVSLGLMARWGYIDIPLTQILWLLAGLVIICAVGVCDDICNLPARWKLLGQVFSVLPIMYGGFVVKSISLCGCTIPLGRLAVPVTIAWLVAGINAINLLDGMDGLASTTGFCIALGTAAVGALVGEPSSVVFALALAGATFGFLVYNLPPARIYLGDAGSMVIGLALAVNTLLVAEDADGASHVTVMLGLMAVPVGDTLLAIVRRKMSGLGIWQADRGHFHHRLLDRGFTKMDVLAVAIGLCMITGTLAAASRLIGWEPLAWGAAMLVAAVLVKTRLIGHHEWSLTKGMVGRRLKLASLSLPTPQQMGRMPFDAVWELLITACETLAVHRLQLTVWQDDDRARRLYWENATAGDATERLAAVELTCGSPESGCCVLRAEPSLGAEGQPGWGDLARILSRFSEHFATHAETALASHMATEDSDEHAIIPLPLHPAAQRHAA